MVIAQFKLWNQTALQNLVNNNLKIIINMEQEPEGIINTSLPTTQRDVEAILQIYFEDTTIFKGPYEIGLDDFNLEYFPVKVFSWACARADILYGEESLASGLKYLGINHTISKAQSDETGYEFMLKVFEDVDCKRLLAMSDQNTEYYLPKGAQPRIISFSLFLGLKDIVTLSKKNEELSQILAPIFQNTRISKQLWRKLSKEKVLEQKLKAYLSVDIVLIDWRLLKRESVCIPICIKNGDPANSWDKILEKLYRKFAKRMDCILLPEEQEFYRSFLPKPHELSYQFRLFDEGQVKHDWTFFNKAFYPDLKLIGEGTVGQLLLLFEPSVARDHFLTLATKLQNEVLKRECIRLLLSCDQWMQVQALYLPPPIYKPRKFLQDAPQLCELPFLEIGQARGFLDSIQILTEQIFARSILANIQQDQVDVANLESVGVVQVKKRDRKSRATSSDRDSDYSPGKDQIKTYKYCCEWAFNMENLQ